jgi:hypothetical protein
VQEIDLTARDRAAGRALSARAPPGIRSGVIAGREEGVWHKLRATAKQPPKETR